MDSLFLHFETLGLLLCWPVVKVQQSEQETCIQCRLKSWPRTSTLLLISTIYWPKQVTWPSLIPMGLGSMLCSLVRGSVVTWWRAWVCNSIKGKNEDLRTIIQATTQVETIAPSSAYFLPLHGILQQSKLSSSTSKRHQHSERRIGKQQNFQN